MQALVTRARHRNARPGLARPSVPGILSRRRTPVPTMYAMNGRPEDWVQVISYENLPGSRRPMDALHT